MYQMTNFSLVTLNRQVDLYKKKKKRLTRRLLYAQGSWDKGESSIKHEMTTILKVMKLETQHIKNIFRKFIFLEQRQFFKPFDEITQK